MAMVLAALIVAGQRPGPEALDQPLLQAEGQRSTGTPLDATVLGEGWEEAFPPETFGPGELYAKIDGGADVYLAHGFRGLRVHSFIHTSGDYVEVFLFDLGEQARAMYEIELPPQTAEDPQFGGYFSGASLFMVHGPLYVQIQAASDTPRTREAVRALGARIVEMPA